jgi:hypothetical protein
MTPRMPPAGTAGALRAMLSTGLLPESSAVDGVSPGTSGRNGEVLIPKG